MAPDESSVRAWSDAGADLGIRVVSPSELGGQDWLTSCIAWVPDFGGDQGALVVSWDSPNIGKIRAAGFEQGLYVSGVAEVYLKYDRQLWIDTLDDWGWFGSGDPPAWYTHGNYWTEC
jgi:hypothetical protein